MQSKIRRVLIVFNPKKDQEAQKYREHLESVFKSLQIQAVWWTIDKREMSVLVEQKEQILSLNSYDMIISCGGDGTLLHVVRQTLHLNLPILGINLGSLGFLTALTPDQIESYLVPILMGHYTLSERMLLEYEIVRNNDHIASNWALNDLVLSRGSHARMIFLDVQVDCEQLTHYHCDGLIFSTPTGSTAYSLSAGGPIVSPKLRALIITPICSHVLTNRSLLIAENEKIHVTIPSDQPEIRLEADGNIQMQLQPKDKVVISSAKKTALLVESPCQSFYTITRQKLRWSGSNL